ncbi:MAG: hypothetical protein WC548_01045 [Candidatus Pacearchaeota archaeon]
MFASGKAEAELAAKQLAKGFIKNGYDVDYVTTHFKGLKKFEVVDGINVYRVKVIGRKELPTATMASLISFLIRLITIRLKYSVLLFILIE